MNNRATENVPKRSLCQLRTQGLTLEHFKRGHIMRKTSTWLINEDFVMSCHRDLTESN